MPRGDEAAVGEEGHAGDLGLRRALHDCRHVHVLRVPQSDGVIETAGDDLGVVRDPLAVLLAQPLGIQRDNLQDGALMPRHVRLLLPALDAEDADPEVRVHEEVARGVSRYDFYLLDFFFFDDLLVHKWLLHVHVQNCQVALLV